MTNGLALTVDVKVVHLNLSTLTYANITGTDLFNTLLKPQKRF